MTITFSKGGMELNKLKKKIKTLRLLVMMLFMLGASLVVTENFYAWTSTSAYQKVYAGYDTIWGGIPYANWGCNACKNGFGWSGTGFYFARWHNGVYPTCTTGGYAIWNCKNVSDSGLGDAVQNSHLQKIWVGPLGHEFTSNYSSSTVGNNGAGDGYWYRKCSHCSTWGKTTTPINYTIRFSDTHISGKSDSGIMNDIKLTYDKAVALTANTYQKAGHRFLGWATSSQGDVVYTDMQQVKNLTVTEGATITLYAVFEQIEFQITYDTCGGIIEGTTESVVNSIEYYGNPVDLSVKAQKDGLVHIGWALTQDALVGLSSMQMPQNDITLYAIYSLAVSDMKEALYVAWDKNNLSNFRSYPLDLVNVDPSGYSYSKLNIKALDELGLTSVDDVDWGVVLYDHAGNSATLNNNTPIPNRYLQTVIHYIWDIEKQEFVYHTTTDELAYEGETYTPAYLQETDEKYPFGFAPSNIDSAYVVTGDTTTSAFYMPIEYKLYFDANGGVCETKSKTVYVNYYYGELPIATREGYDFVGWFTDPVAGVQVRNTDTYTTAGDSTVHAHWKVHTHNVVYDFWTNGGTDSSVYNAYVDYGAKLDLSVTATKEGWTFVGWNTNPDATEGLKDGIMPDKDVVLYAIFRKDITATFISATDETEINSQVVTVSIYGDVTQGKILVPQQSVMDKWECLGWSLSEKADASIDVSSGTTIFLSDDTTYYGCYSREVTISYDTNGSAWDIPDMTQEAYFNASGEKLYPTFEIAAAPTLDKHSFVEWQEIDKEGKVVASYKASEEVSISKDKLLIAKWDKHPEIEAYDRYFTLEEAQNGEITSDKLLEKVIATDREDGVLNNGIDVIVLDFSTSDFVSGAEVTITFQATDSFGNVVTKSIVVKIVDTTVNLSKRVVYPRFISARFYSDENGLLSYEEGGLRDTSVWRTKESYKRLLETALFNEKTDVEYKDITALGVTKTYEVAGSGNWETTRSTWNFTHEDIKAAQEFITDYGYGNVRNEDGMEKFLELFGHCRTSVD